MGKGMDQPLIMAIKSLSRGVSNVIEVLEYTHLWPCGKASC